MSTDVLKSLLVSQQRPQVFHQLVPLAVAVVERQDWTPRSASVPERPFERILRARYSAFLESPVSSRNDPLEPDGFVQVFRGSGETGDGQLVKPEARFLRSQSEC